MLKNPEEKIDRAFNSGVSFIVTVVDVLRDWEKALDLVEKYDRVFFAAGVHPHDGDRYSTETETRLKELVKHNKCVAVGETGLDFYYMHSSRKGQEAAFRAQIEVALEADKPVVVHSRDSLGQTLNILRGYRDIRGRVLFHCFSGDEQAADKALFLDPIFSFAGNITYPGAENLRRAARHLPVSRILVETDCPFLTPQAVRREKNEPSFVRYTFEYISALKGIKPEELASEINRTASNFFGIDLTEP